MVDTKQFKEKAECHLTVFSISVILLILLTGCAALKPESGKVTQPDVSKPSVTENEDVGKGFVITETAQLKESSRKDFEEAVLLLKEEDYDSDTG